MRAICGNDNPHSGVRSLKCKAASDLFDLVPAVTRSFDDDFLSTPSSSTQASSSSSIGRSPVTPKDDTAPSVGEPGDAEGRSFLDEENVLGDEEVPMMDEEDAHVKSDSRKRARKGKGKEKAESSTDNRGEAEKGEAESPTKRILRARPVPSPAKLKRPAEAGLVAEGKRSPAKRFKARH